MSGWPAHLALNPEHHLEYQNMQAKGASPESVFLAFERQYDSLAGIRTIRAVFGLSLEAAKEVMIRAHGDAMSLDECQAQLLPSLKQALQHEDWRIHDAV